MLPPFEGGSACHNYLSQTVVVYLRHYSVVVPIKDNCSVFTFVNIMHPFSRGSGITLHCPKQWKFSPSAVAIVCLSLVAGGVQQHQGPMNPVRRFSRCIAFPLHQPGLIRAEIALL